ncbi:hypothetical protein ANO11243_091980 [Dothideomycetidae sp. 11243]|nr:hypothetical protein ANO11243_091980 [fungal sp. No.11243]
MAASLCFRAGFMAPMDQVYACLVVVFCIIGVIVWTARLIRLDLSLVKKASQTSSIPRRLEEGPRIEAGPDAIPPPYSENLEVASDDSAIGESSQPSRRKSLILCNIYFAAQVMTIFSLTSAMLNLEYCRGEDPKDGYPPWLGALWVFYGIHMIFASVGFVMWGSIMGRLFEREESTTRE